MPDKMLVHSPVMDMIVESERMHIADKKPEVKSRICSLRFEEKPNPSNL